MKNPDREIIKVRSVHGIFALFSRAFFVNILSYITSLVIFTYLSPSDVGIYVAVIAIQRIISFITDFGFGAALVQKKEKLGQPEMSTAFTLQLIVTLAIFSLLFLFRDTISLYFHLTKPGTRLLLVLGFTIFISSFKVIPSILLERDIQFHKLVLPQIGESLLFNVLLIILVVKGYGIDSYSVAFLASSLIGIPLYYFISPWKAHFSIEKKALRNLKYGLQFQAKNILATVKDDFLTVFLSKVLSYTELGYIGFGQRNAFFVYRYIVDNVTKVTFSTYSRIQDDAQALKNTLEKSLFYVTLVTFPLMSGIILIAPYIVLYFPRWHAKWEPALISLTFFSLNALISSISGILVNVLDATGKVKITLRLMVGWTTLTWILTPIAILQFGYNGVAIASFLVTLSIFLTVYLVKQVMEFNFLQSIIRPLVGAILMSLATYALEKIFVVDLTSLLLAILISGFVYCAVIYIIAYKTITEDIKYLRKV